MNASQINSDWGSTESHGHTNVFLMLHRLLRGRYLITILLAGVFAVAGGAAGFLSQSPLYRSDSLIKIEPVLPKILFDTEQSTAPRMFASFVSTQAQLIRSSRSIESAMSSDVWRSVAPISGIATVEDFGSRIKVKTTRAAQQLIYVSFEHENAEVAQRANAALINAYVEVYGSQDLQENRNRMGVLESRRNSLNKDRERVDGDITEVMLAEGTDQLIPLINIQIEKQARQEILLDDVRRQISEFDRLSKQAEQNSNSTGLTLEQAAMIDSDIAELVNQKRVLDAQLLELAADGVLSEHRQFKRIKSALDRVESEINRRIDVLRESILAGNTGPSGGGAGTREELVRQEEALVAALAATRQRKTELSESNLLLRERYSELATIEKDLLIVDNRIDAIETESRVKDSSDVSGKISIANPANRPSRPSSDKRIKLAGAGFIGGGALPVVGMLGLGFTGRRIRYSDDGILESAHSRIVGVLPDLGDTLSDRELADASAFAVHQIRSQLQILYRGDDTSIFAVTSPAPGDGKTSMIIALALSFAESGDRTLLIDLDLIGRGLSLHFGHPNAVSLADAASTGADLVDMVQPTSFDRLSILPAGMDDEMRISRLSPLVVKRLIESFRDKYDTVLIDSGPILGSIEAGLLAPSVDGMLMVVGRGQLRPLVKRAVDQISGVGGQVVATIFNRASIGELRQSSSSMSVHFSRQASRQAAEQASGPASRSGVGPLGGSLFSSRPAAEQGRDLEQSKP